jgi:hypothetical protein
LRKVIAATNAVNKKKKIYTQSMVILFILTRE